MLSCRFQDLIGDVASVKTLCQRSEVSYTLPSPTCDLQYVRTRCISTRPIVSAVRALNLLLAGKVPGEFRHDGKVGRGAHSANYKVDRVTEPARLA